MASIVAYIELREGAVTRASRFAVAEARRVADAAGATVYALLTVGALGQAAIDRLAAEVSAAGADRIFCSSADTLAGPPLDFSHGPLLAQIAEHLRPVLFLFPAGGAGAELGPPLAVRIGAGYLANASVQVVPEERAPDLPSQRIVLRRWRSTRDGQRWIDIGDYERPLVASLACGFVPAPLGEAYAEVEMVPCPEPGHALPRVISSEPDGTSEAELCSALVWVEVADAASARAALPAELPEGVTVVAGGGATALPAASPIELYLLSSEAPGQALLALLAPGSKVARLVTKAQARR